MPVVFHFWGNQVGTLSGISDEGGGDTRLDVGQMPFLATDLIVVTFSDASFDANGEFLPFGDVIYTDVKVVRDGTTYDLSVDTGSIRTTLISAFGCIATFPF